MMRMCKEKRSIEDRVLKVTTQIERKRKQWTVFEKKEGTEPTQGLSQFLICDRGWVLPNDYLPPGFVN